MSPKNQNFLSAADLRDLTGMRHHLHQFPEISGNERETAAQVAQWLSDLAPDQLVTGLGGTGVAALFQGSAPGPTVMFRCELDALPIHEETDLPYQSKNPGVGHLCGHDGHMAIMLGLARLLSRQAPKQGRVVLLFQPAEEDGSGAKAVIEDPEFAALHPDFSFSLHNFPGVPLGHVLLREGPVNCASRGLRVTFRGKTAHAAQPEHGLSPALAVAECLKTLPKIGDAVAQATGDLAMLTVTHCKMGEAVFGSTPGYAEIWVTLRTLLDDQMTELAHRCETFLHQTAKASGLAVEFLISDDFAHCENAPGATAVFETVLDRLGISRSTDHLPIRASEDFGRFRALGDSAMIFIGSGEAQPMLHNPDYDFPDQLIEDGVRIFYEISAELLSEGKHPS